MEYREIVAVTGLSGLYQLVTTKSDGAIVRSIADKTTKFISARQHHVTPLDSIEVYTTGDNVRLHFVFMKMLEIQESHPLVDIKKADNNAIKGYFKTVLPDFDEDRVYVSDMKKMLKWFEILKANDLLKPEEIEQEVEVAIETPQTEEEKPKKASTKKKKTETAESEAEVDSEDKTVKKATRKKKTEE